MCLEKKGGGKKHLRFPVLKLTLNLFSYHHRTHCMNFQELLQTMTLCKCMPAGKASWFSLRNPQRLLHGNRFSFGQVSGSELWGPFNGKC